MRLKEEKGQKNRSMMRKLHLKICQNMEEKDKEANYKRR